jgi:hypothetical protein
VIKLSAPEKDEIEEQLSRDQLKNHFIGVIFDEILSILAFEKNRRFVIFWTPF